MSNLFKKAAVFTDIHFGLKSNSVVHNEDCLAFVRWAVDLAKAQGCETCIFTGDWHNNRAALNILTLNCSDVNILNLFVISTTFHFEL